MEERTLLTFGSLFAGIGGFDLGLERAGMKCKWQVEIDDYASKVLAKHWPNVTRFRDVRECGRHNLANVDLICGGFPCQDISNAGKRAGIDGERSGLWSEYARIIRELRPQYVLVENVAALLGRGMGRVLGDLAACGYDAEWDMLPACAFGAKHIRERLWILSYPYEKRPQRRIFGMWKDQERRTFDASLLSIQLGANHWDALPSSRVCRVANGIPNRAHRTMTVGNSIVPQIAEWIGRRIIAAEEHGAWKARNF